MVAVAQERERGGGGGGGGEVRPGCDIAWMGAQNPEPPIE